MLWPGTRQGLGGTRHELDIWKASRCMCSIARGQIHFSGTECNTNDGDRLAFNDVSNPRCKGRRPRATHGERADNRLRGPVLFQSSTDRRNHGGPGP